MSNTLKFSLQSRTWSKKGYGEWSEEHKACMTAAMTDDYSLQRAIQCRVCKVFVIATDSTAGVYSSLAEHLFDKHADIHEALLDLRQKGTNIVPKTLVKFKIPVGPREDT